MKKLLTIMILTLLHPSCSHDKNVNENKTAETNATTTKEANDPSFIIKYPTDTINYTDVNNKKQGLWIDIDSKNKNRVIYKDDTAYAFTDSTVQNLVKMLNKK